MAGFAKIRRRYQNKPSRFIRPDLAHPDIRGGVLWLPLLTDSSSTTHDALGKYHATITGTLSYAVGEYNNYLMLPGTSGNYLSASTPAITGDVTIALLLAPNDVNGNAYISDFGGQDDFAVILGYQNGFYNAYDGAYPIGNSPANSQIAASGVGLWDWLVWTKKGTLFSGYLNGVLKVSGTITHGTWQPSANLQIGQRYNSSFYWNGSLADYRVLNRAMSAAEIATTYNRLWVPFERRIWVPVAGAPPTANPKGPLGHPLQGALGGPI